MNKTERMYALVEELRAVAPRPRSSSWLAQRFEVSTRTIERDLAALLQAGVPIWANAGRSGGYSLDATMTLPPLPKTLPDSPLARHRGSSSTRLPTGASSTSATPIATATRPAEVSNLPA